MAAPTVLLQVGRERAASCLARIEQPRAARLPQCSAIDRWFDLPARWPFTRRWAQLFREELAARMAMASYVDAAVGAPSRAAQRKHFPALLQAAQLVEEGTGRVRLAQLGRATGAPDPGQLAYSTGDRQTLIDRGFEWTQWYTSNRAMEAALLHGELSRAVRLAEHYAGRPDPDLRLHLGALLCLGGQAERGLEHVRSVERARAEKRNANMARNFGAARVIVEECAHRAGLEAPPIPAYGGAGEWDHRERHAVMRLRHARQQQGCSDLGKLDSCVAFEQLSSAAEGAMKLLGSGIALDFRLELSAAVAELLRDGDAALELVRHRDGEPTAVSRTPLTVRRLVERDRPGQPAVHPAQLTGAADHLLSLEPRHPAVAEVAGAMLARAAAGYAGLGQLEPALDRARRAAPLVLDDAAGAGLFEASVAFIAGDAALAIERLTAALAKRPAADPVVAASRIQLAQLLAAAGRHADARAEAARAVEAAAATDHPVLLERAAWVQLALDSHQRTMDRRGEGQAAGPSPPQLPFVGPPRGWVADEARQRTLARAHDVWRRWLAAPASTRRACRYEAYRTRGDAPEARVAHLFLAGLLVDAPSEVEPWLDAYYALDASASSLRGYAFARATAAAWRGDQPARRLWLDRYRTLERWAQDPADADLFQRLRL
jgi:hypothetical protein